VTPRRGPRRARLVVKRLDPWSVLKITFVYSLAVYVVILVAVVLLYGLLSAMGVFHALDKFFHDVGASTTLRDYLGFGRIFLVTFVVGAINVVLFTALATLGAFIYNLCSDLVGGLEVTLTEAD
jgi:ABC-type phosphate transport system permease subunit